MLRGTRNNSKRTVIVDGSGEDFEVDKDINLTIIPGMDVTEEMDSQGIHSPIIVERGIRRPNSNYDFVEN